MPGFLPLLSFSLAMLLAQFSPGPDMLLLTSTALSHGWKKTFWMVVGIATGLLVHTTLALAGLSALLLHENVIRWVELAAAIYLGYLAWRLWSVKPRSAVASSSHEANSGTVSLTKVGAWQLGLWCNLLNPKAVLFLASFLVPFLQPDSPLWWRGALFTVVIGQALLFWTIYIRLLDHPAFRQWFMRHEVLLHRCFGSVMALFAGSLMIDVMG
jgi:threonine efflux protein